MLVWIIIKVQMHLYSVINQKITWWKQLLDPDLLMTQENCGLFPVEEEIMLNS